MSRHFAGATVGTRPGTTARTPKRVRSPAGSRRTPSKDGMADTATSAAPVARTERALPFAPALDGLRAIAVTAVLLYHGGVDWMPGGFLGVDLFFVLSGYLITSLLLAERRGTGGIDLRAFWLRRARRLLPGGLPRDRRLPGRCRGDPRAGRRSRRRAATRSPRSSTSTTGTSCWSDQSYFAAFERPSLLQPPVVARDRGAVLPAVAARARASALARLGRARHRRSPRSAGPCSRRC